MKLSPADKPNPDKSIAIQTALQSLALCWKTQHSLLLGNSRLLQFCSSISSKLWQLRCIVLILRVKFGRGWVFFILHPFASATKEVRISTLLRLEKLSISPRSWLCILPLTNPIYMQEYWKQWLEKCNMRLNLCCYIKVSVFSFLTPSYKYSGALKREGGKKLHAQHFCYIVTLCERLLLKLHNFKKKRKKLLASFCTLDILFIFRYKNKCFYCYNYKW